MATISKVVADSSARHSAFELLAINEIERFVPISNQSFGCVVLDDNGDKRMVEIKAIVRKIDEELDGDELLQFEADEYENSLAEKAAKKAKAEKEKTEKIKKDKKKREAKKGE